MWCGGQFQVSRVSWGSLRGRLHSVQECVRKLEPFPPTGLGRARRDGPRPPNPPSADAVAGKVAESLPWEVARSASSLPTGLRLGPRWPMRPKRPTSCRHHQGPTGRALLFTEQPRRGKELSLSCSVPTKHLCLNAKSQQGGVCYKSPKSDL